MPSNIYNRRGSTDGSDQEEPPLQSQKSNVAKTKAHLKKKGFLIAGSFDSQFNLLDYKEQFKILKELTLELRSGIETAAAKSGSNSRYPSKSQLQNNAHAARVK